MTPTSISVGPVPVPARMSGPDVVLPEGGAPGVFAWRPPAALVVEASDLLAGAR